MKIPIILENRKFLLKTCGVGLLLGAIVIFITPKEYESSIFTVYEGIVREFDDADLLAASVGIKTSKYVIEAIRPTLYQQVIGSTPFLISLFSMPVTPATSKKANTITLFEYMSEHQRSPWWKTIASIPFKAISFMSGLWEKDENLGEADSIGKVSDIFRLTKREMAVAGAISQRISVGVDKRKRTITLTIRMQDPLVAATVADSVSAYLKAFVIDYRTKKERKNLEYVEKIYRQSCKEYHAAQEAYARFADKNQSLARKTAQVELIRLKTSMDLAYSDYAKMTQRMQFAKNSTFRERPVYAVIEPAKVPLTPVAPRKTIILISSIILSAMAGYGWIQLKSKLL